MRELIDLSALQYYIDKFSMDQIFDHRITGECRLFEYDKGDMVIEAYTQMHYLLFIVEGEAKIFNTLDNGKNYLLRIEGPLQVYGDVEILEDQNYTANVEALSLCRFIGIPVRVIRRDYLEHPMFLRFIIDSLAARLIKISYRSMDNVLLPLKNKLASYLLLHKEKQSDLIELKSNLTDIAENLGTTYRHLSRTLSEFVNEGYINRQGKKIEVKNIGKLEELAGNTYRD